MADKWFIKEEHTICEYRDHNGEHYICYHEDSESQYCKDETCPKKVKEVPECQK